MKEEGEEEKGKNKQKRKLWNVAYVYLCLMLAHGGWVCIECCLCNDEQLHVNCFTLLSTAIASGCLVQLSLWCCFNLLFADDVAF